jgi:GxxExxY protein
LGKYYDLSEQVIGAAIEVHRALGPGLLESAYEECLAHELELRGLSFQRQISLPIIYKSVQLDCGYRIDLMVENYCRTQNRRKDSANP